VARGGLIVEEASPVDRSVVEVLPKWWCQVIGGRYRVDVVGVAYLAAANLYLRLRICSCREHEYE